METTQSHQPTWIRITLHQLAQLQEHLRSLCLQTNPNLPQALIHSKLTRTGILHERQTNHQKPITTQPTLQPTLSLKKTQTNCPPRKNIENFLLPWFPRLYSPQTIRFVFPHRGHPHRWEVHYSPQLWSLQNVPWWHQEGPLLNQRNGFSQKLQELLSFLKPNQKNHLAWWFGPCVSVILEEYHRAERITTQHHGWSLQPMENFS